MPSRHLIGRRDFLIASSTCALATTVLGPGLFAAEAAPAKRLAVGFARDAELTRLVPASSIPAGDGTFIRAGALLTLSGASGPSADPLARRAVELRADFAYFKGAQVKSAPFYAWAANRRTGGQGNSIRFTIPTDVTQQIALSVVVATTTSGKETALPLVLSVKDGDPTALKLARGFYVIVPLFDAEPAPDWSSYRLLQLEGRWTLVDAAGNSAPFEHLVLHVDYAMA